VSRLAEERAAPNAFWTQGDTAPALSERLLDGNGVAVDLTGATVRFQARYAYASDAANAIDQPAIVVAPATNGIVSYTPTAADTDTPGDLYLQWRVLFGGVAVEHFRSSTYQKVRIRKATA
jgi:hypothetical protein